MPKRASKPRKKAPIGAKGLKAGGKPKRPSKGPKKAAPKKGGPKKGSPTKSGGAKPSGRPWR